METLMTKKLKKLPIGTHVEVAYGNGTSHHEKVTGIITDSDFIQNVEITEKTEAGFVESILDFDIVKSVQIQKTLCDILQELPVGTKIRFSCEDGQRTPDLEGTVSDNDHMENVEIKMTSGKEMLLNYSVFQSLLVVSKIGQNTAVRNTKDDNSAVPKKSVPETPVNYGAKTPLHKQEPEGTLNASDYTLKTLFEELPPNDRKKLNSVYDSFKYGIKIKDKAKMADAAKVARQVLFAEEKKGYYWSERAAIFCGSLLCRVNIYDPEVLLVGGCLSEAAFASWKLGDYTYSGAYAAVAMVDYPEEITRDLVIILTTSIIKSKDASVLSALKERMGTKIDSYLKEVADAAFAAAGVSFSAGQNLSDAFYSLSMLYPNTDMAEEFQNWMEETDEEAGGGSNGSVSKIPTITPKPEMFFGKITYLNWMEKTGTITDFNGATYKFRYQDIEDASLAAVIKECLKGDLGGETYLVKFCAENGMAQKISQDCSLVDKAKSIATDVTVENRFEKAFELCKAALNTADIRRALRELIRHACTIYAATQQSNHLKEALTLFEKHSTHFPQNAFDVMIVAQAYGNIKKYPQMLEYAEKALAFPGQNVKQKISLLSQYLKMIREYYEFSRDKALLAKVLEKTEKLQQDYKSDFQLDPKNRELYNGQIPQHSVFAACSLDLLETAEREYKKVPGVASIKHELAELLEKTRARLAPAAEVPEEVAAETEEKMTQNNSIPEIEEFEEIVEEEEIEEEIIPYTDADGWDALNLTKQDVVDYALRISGPDRIPAILAYLRAGASLNKEITPIYHAIALAANDPMEAPNYSITALVTALEASDAQYPVLNDCCLAAAFLRTSFISGRGYDYSAQGLRNSISITQQLPALSNAYDTLEKFRKEVGWAIDIYADYRNHGVKKLEEDLDAVVRRADELYTKFVATPAREGVKFARLLETKKIAFARDGYLATMLRYILERDGAALEKERENFISTYLNGSEQFSVKHISVVAIDKIIEDCWDLAGKNMQLKKVSATLQGDRRNNLRSNISEVFSLICQWYALSEQSAGLTWKTEQGEKAYLDLRPQLIQQLKDLSEDCAANMDSCPDPELTTGLFLLAATAKELSARLDGSWKFDQEKYLYADFLRSNHVMLNKDFTPELTSTFCVLPEFNIMARIRKHVEGEKLSFGEQINAIYGMDKSCNNYGTAARIMEYLEVFDDHESVQLPDQADVFHSQTEMQIDMRFRSFRETYALAMNYGQIIKTDAFCYTLEDTVRYWYAFCKETKNYGFFTSILLQAEEQIHASAQQYESQLDEQLEALISSNQEYFENHPDYAEAIQSQIANQNFTVAEDWMARIRIGDFSLDVQEQEALGYLEQFWNSYVLTYNRVADASRTLSALLGRREARNKDAKRAQQMIDSWLSNGRSTNADRISQLLNLLGWQNIHVSQYPFAEERGEFYEVSSASSTAGLITPIHPIAAFGSNLEKKKMYVACLYGTYDCDRLYEKMRALDGIDGSKVILLDYALGQTDRRALARKLKKSGSSLRNVNIVIDRVLITHLANNYNENLISRILMAIAMPFSYCQPYVVESVHTMPPEIFIGRKDELLKIEEADGVNLIYGGRQLGKSALFKKALADLDGRQQKRAVLIDIKELDCTAAARKLSTKLIDLDITPDAEVTDDWDVLCRNIERRLRSKENEISYFLLMLDEADAFISDCAKCGYRPLVALKDIQQSLPGQFKYVLAGLHNIVKFNRQVALGNNSVITHMPSLKITPFRTPEAQELLTGPLSYLGFSLPSKVTVSQILATCNYFPGLIQLYAKKLIESVRAADYAGYDIKKTPPYVVSDEHLRRVMSDKEFVDQIHEKFEITLTLDQDQGSCYYPLTLLIGWMYYIAPSKNGYTAKDVLHHAKDLSVYPLVNLDEEKIDALLQELQDLNILRSVSNNSYLLASKNFRDLLGSDVEIFEKLMKIGGAAG